MAEELLELQNVNENFELSRLHDIKHQRVLQLYPKL